MDCIIYKEDWFATTWNLWGLVMDNNIDQNNQDNLEGIKFFLIFNKRNFK